MRNIKKIITTLSAVVLCLQLTGNRLETAKIVKAQVLQKEAAQDTIPLQTACGRDNTYVQEIGGTWKFGGKQMSVENALKADYTLWEDVTIPHTWNAKDGEDGGSNYLRTSYWYHKDFNVETLDGKRIYMEFTGVNTKTDVYINGKSAGDKHKGGYTTFRYDITELVKAGSNVMDICTDNTYDQEIAPISGDFNMYGGIYRRVYMITTNDVHIELDNNGSSGIFLKTGNMRSKERPESLGSFTLETNIINSSDKDRTVHVVTTVTGKNAPETITDEVTIPSGQKITYTKDITIKEPVLWEGINYEKGADNSNAGYQYNISVEIKEGTEVLDKVSEKTGFRYFYIDPGKDGTGEDSTGFYLNGKPYPLRGVNRHSYIAGAGSAMTEEQHKKDMEILTELGANAIRLCHYPQTDYFYDLCDENGIIVWTEIPVVNEIRVSGAFAENTKKQLEELVKQQYNRPCVCFWGLENEIGNGASLTNPKANPNLAGAKKLLNELDTLAHTLDTTGRYTTQAVNRYYSMDQNKPGSVDTDFDNNTGWKSDIIAWNIYPGWYPDANFHGTFEEVMKRKNPLDSRPMGISEYGWGANVTQHENNPVLGQNNLSAGGKWHPEEYQNIMNEEAISYINQHNELWGTFYWVMFDFAVDSRNEGSQPALNDKGLVTADRSVKKDSFYLYKANWNKKENFTYITSRRWTERNDAYTYVKVYSNCDEVELFIDGKSLGKMKSNGNGVFITDNIVLKNGNTVIKTIGTCVNNTNTYEDTCTWEYHTLPFNTCDIEVLGDKFVYDGTTQTPGVIVTAPDGTFLSEGTGYTVSYKNNQNTGKATVIIQGKGNYTGKVTKSFYIVPKSVKQLKVVNPKTQNIKVSWKKDSQADGYEITYTLNKKMSGNKKTVSINSKNTTNKIISGLEKGKTYYIKIRAYKNISGKKYYGAFCKTVKIKCK